MIFIYFAFFLFQVFNLSKHTVDQDPIFEIQDKRVFPSHVAFTTTDKFYVKNFTTCHLSSG